MLLAIAIYSELEFRDGVKKTEGENLNCCVPERKARATTICLALWSVGQEATIRLQGTELLKS